MTPRATPWTEALKQDIEAAIQAERHDIAGEEEHSAPTFVSEYSLHQIWNLSSICKRWDGAGFPPPKEIFASDSGLIKIASILILIVRKGHRLPFIKEPPKQAAGAFSTVTKVHVASNHFRYADSGQLDHEHERILACKCSDSAESIEAYPTPNSLSAGSGSAPKATDSGRYKIPTESRAYSFVSKKPATALSICPSAEQIILSFSAGMLSLKLKHVDSNPVLNFDIQSNKSGQAAWKHVHTAGEYLVVRGFNNKPKGNYKHVLSGQPSYLAPETYADHYYYHLDSRLFKLARPLALLVVLILEQVYFFCDISPAFQRIGQRDFSLLYDLALSTKGDVALLFSNRLELYNANAERRLDYHIPSRYGSEEFKTMFFSRFGSRLIACSWTHWYMWNKSMWTIDPSQAADSSPQYTGTIQPDSDYSKSRPIIIPFTDQDAFFLYDAEDGTLRLYRAQVKETPRVSCPMICGIVMPDDTGLLFIRAVKRKVFSTPKYVLLHRPIRQDGIGEEQELAEVDYLKYRKDYKLEMAFCDTVPSDQVRIQIIDAVHD